jgi:hypothetical protein
LRYPKASIAGTDLDLEDEVEKTGSACRKRGDRFSRIYCPSEVQHSHYVVISTVGMANSHVVAKVVKWAYDRGAKGVIVGDSPFYCPNCYSASKENSA